MSRILFVTSLLLLGAGILSSTPMNATRHPGAVVSSTEEPLTEVANNSSQGATVNSTEASIQRTTGLPARPTNVNVKTTKATTFQPTGPPAVTAKPGRCPAVGFLVQPQDRHPFRGRPLKTRFKLGFSSSSSEEFHSDSKEGFGRLYHYYRHHHGHQERPDPCRAPDCRMDGDCLGEMKCCRLPGCGMKCLRPVLFDQLPGGQGSPRRYVASPALMLPP